MTKQAQARSRTAIATVGFVFIVLKLCGVIRWSWWWVTIPFWGGLALAGAGFVLFCIGYAIKFAIEDAALALRKNRG